MATKQQTEARVVFSHPRIKPDLTIAVNPDEITWSYGLNTASYPTYGGEVVQILSLYFGDMTVKGTVSTYAELERIYVWFIRYMQDATQGTFGPSYDQIPVSFFYNERNWHFEIWPKSLPGFRYGRDVVAPTWQMVAAVKEPDVDFRSQLMTLAVYNAQHHVGQQDWQFTATTADFSKSADLTSNPFASPDADPSLKGQTMTSWYAKQAKALSDTFVGFVQDYSGNTLDKLAQFENISKTPDLSGKSSTTTKKKK